MSESEPNQSAQPEPEAPQLDADGETGEQQLCIGCLAPNNPLANFCVKCGAPLSAYASIMPFERLFAEGYIYRQASEKPHRLIVVAGIWFLFGLMIILSAARLFITISEDTLGIFDGLLFSTIIAISILLVFKTTKNYWLKKEIKTNLTTNENQ